MLPLSGLRNLQMKPRISLRAFLCLCVAIAIAAVWTVNYWSYDIEWSEGGFAYNDSELLISETYERLKTESPNQGLEIIERPSWATKYDWKSGKTTWFKMTDKPNNVVLCINDFGGYLEALIIGNKRCLPWQDNAKEMGETANLVRKVRKWWGRPAFALQLPGTSTISNKNPSLTGSRMTYRSKYLRNK